LVPLPKYEDHRWSNYKERLYLQGTLSILSAGRYVWIYVCKYIRNYITLIWGALKVIGATKDVISLFSMESLPQKLENLEIMKKNYVLSI
jgi:hypothetical protein